MLRLFKSSLCAALVLAGTCRSVYGFSLLGPVNEVYQVPVIGYNLDTDIGAPKNFGQGYRRNTPVMYYACDAAFSQYFGSNGVAAVDAAFQIFNDLTNVSSYSSDLSEFPLTSSRKNWSAEAMSMIDIKSITMQLILEQLGLAEPVRFNWTLHDRYLLPNGSCPLGMAYQVVQRNFDPVFSPSPSQLAPTPYVNGTLYTYAIIEACTGLNPLALAFDYPTDPTADSYTAVAEYFSYGYAASPFAVSPFGLFYTGLTRDDVGGLRYLMRAQNVNWESAGPDSYAQLTNTTPTLLVSSNLALLTAQALTNAPAALLALYPNLNIIATSNFFSNIYTTNLTAFFTNYPWDPVGTPAHLGFITNVTASVLTMYQETFGNVLQLIPNGSGGWTAIPLSTPPTANQRVWVSVQTTTVGTTNQPWSPAGTITTFTNTTTQTYKTNGIFGDYVILPTNECEVAILSSQLTNVLSFTNPVTSATNFLANTNVAGTLLGFTQNLVTYFTNHYFVTYPVNCVASNTALYAGVEKINFIRRDYDSIFGRFWNPITNDYILYTVTNFTLFPQHVSRILVRPDIYIGARDFAPGPPDNFSNVVAVFRTIFYNTNNANQFNPGPGTIESGSGPSVAGPLPQSQFLFNNVGPIFYNAGLVDTNAFLQQITQVPFFIWGSFDGTTNPPTVYPNYISVLDIQNEMLIQVTPRYLPDGTVNNAYYAQMQTAASTPNWTAPYSWALAPSSPGLPPGLTLETAADSSGIISGTPTQDGFFDFILRVTDAQGRTIDRSFSIRIMPTP